MITDRLNFSGISKTIYRYRTVADFICFGINFGLPQRSFLIINFMGL